MKSIFRGSRWPLTTLILFSSAAPLLGAEPQCFRVALPNLAENSPRYSVDTERWCYWTENGETLVFNAESPRLELAALVRDHEIVHGSLSHGVTSIHRSRVTDVNPLPVPLASTGLARDNEALPVETFAAARALRAQFAATRARAFAIELAEGTTNVQLEEAQQPFAGYWWPQVGTPLAAGRRSPLGKYDAIVAHWTKANPDSEGWEKKHHAASESWAGHCNGWAASAILYPDVNKLLWSKEAQLVVLPSDLKGMLAETSFCVENAFYGHRYDGKPGDDLQDIYPAQFHQVLVYYLNELKKPIAFDHEANEPVDNNVISGYRMTVHKLNSAGTLFRVYVELHNHDYEHRRNEQGGPAKFVPYQYQYTLQLDGQSKIVGGDWESENPDFLWAPVAQKNCGSENPRVDPAQLDKMLTTLPEAKRQSVPILFEVDRKLRAHEAVKIPFKGHTGTGFQVTIHKNNFGNPVKLVAMGAPLYPSEVEEYQVMAQEPLDGTADSEVYLPLSDITSLQIVNDAKYSTRGNHLVIEKVEFWAGDGSTDLDGKQ